MRKILSFILCFNILMMPAYCIEDVLVEKTLDKNLQIKTIVPKKISDDFVEKTLDKNLQIKTVEKTVIKDDLITLISKDKLGPRKKKLVVFDNSSVQEVPVKIIESFSTKNSNEIDEGDFIFFETLKDVTLKGKLFPKGTQVKARIEMISMNDKKGVPADLIVGNFQIDEIVLDGEITKVGANRSLWIYPLSYVMSFFVGTGVFLQLIRGGHAKISPSEVFVLYVQK